MCLSSVKGTTELTKWTYADQHVTARMNQKHMLFFFIKTFFCFLECNAFISFYLYSWLSWWILSEANNELTPEDMLSCVDILLVYALISVCVLKCDFFKRSQLLNVFLNAIFKQRCIKCWQAWTLEVVADFMWWVFNLSRLILILLIFSFSVFRCHLSNIIFLLSILNHA